MRPTAPTSNTFSLGRRLDSSSFSSNSDPLSTSPPSSKFVVGTAPQPLDKANGTTRPMGPMQDASQHDTLGQLSFAPATQTTVVVTTTTTTTNFPPFVMRTPTQLHDLDPKLYPLAGTPTPQSMKRFCFDIDGKPTFFRETEATGETLQEVSPIVFITWRDPPSPDHGRLMLMHKYICSFNAIMKLYKRLAASSSQGQPTIRTTTFRNHTLGICLLDL